GRPRGVGAGLGQGRVRGLRARGRGGRAPARVAGAAPGGWGRRPGVERDAGRGRSVAMGYWRLGPTMDDHPDIEAAGWAGARVFELLLKVSARFDLRGALPAKYADPAFLAKRWKLGPDAIPGLNPEDFI